MAKGHLERVPSVFGHDNFRRRPTKIEVLRVRVAFESLLAPAAYILSRAPHCSQQRLRAVELLRSFPESPAKPIQAAFTSAASAPPATTARVLHFIGLPAWLAEFTVLHFIAASLYLHIPALLSFCARARPSQLQKKHGCPNSPIAELGQPRLFLCSSLVVSNAAHRLMVCVSAVLLA